jgi:hypothetical protein
MTWVQAPETSCRNAAKDYVDLDPVQAVASCIGLPFIVFPSTRVYCMSLNAGWLRFRKLGFSNGPR